MLQEEASPNWGTLWTPASLLNDEAIDAGGFTNDAAWSVLVVGNGSVVPLWTQPYFGASLLQFFFVVRLLSWSPEHS